MIDIVIVNSSSALPDHAVKMVIPGLQAHINEELQPNGGATLHFVGRHDDMPKEMLPLFLLDHADNHENMTLPDNTVFVADAICKGESWVAEATHLIVAMLANQMTKEVGERHPERRVPRPRTSIAPPETSETEVF